MGATILAVKTGFARLPAGVTWRHIYGIAALTGVGFTMSLFIGLRDCQRVSPGGTSMALLR